MTGRDPMTPATRRKGHRAFIMALTMLMEDASNPDPRVRKRALRLLERHRPQLEQWTKTPTTAPETPASIETESQRLFREARSETQHRYGISQSAGIVTKF